jgi:hypothetical protein
LEIISLIFKGLEGVKVHESSQISYKISEKQVKTSQVVRVTGSVGMHQVEVFEKAKRETSLVVGVNLEIDVKVEIDVGSLYIPINDVIKLSTNHKTPIIPEEGQLLLILFWSKDS